MQYHVEVEEDTVSNWAAVDAYRTALETLLGPGAVETLAADARCHMTDFETTARMLYSNFMRAAQHLPGSRS